jgi:hypothetical protein
VNHRSTDSSDAKKILRVLFRGWADAIGDVVSIAETFQTSAKPYVSMGVFLLSILVTWFVYVPVHELFHAGGCIVSGGQVQELVLDRKYGAALLNRIFPFIIPSDSVYAGRLTGFDPGSDAGYFITVFTPYILTLFPGVWLLRYAAKRGSLWIAGSGCVIGLAPFTNLTGDYFEIGTIFSTKIWNYMFQGAPARSMEGFWSLRSDDMFRLISEILTSPGSYGLPGIKNFFLIAVVISSGLLLAALISGWTYSLGRSISLKIESFFARYE